MYLVECWIENPSLKINKKFIYLSDFDIARGVRVKLNFNNKEVIGFTDTSSKLEVPLEDYEKDLGYKLKKISEVIDEKPLINKDQYDLAMWLSYTCVSSVISCFQTILPSKLKPRSSKTNIVYVKYIKAIVSSEKLTLKQEEAYKYLLNKKEVLLSDFNKDYRSVYKSLLNKKAVEVFEKEKTNSVNIDYEAHEFLKLTLSQEEALNKIEESKKITCLLHGVTGSGKTEVYLHLARRYLEKKKQVLILVPEISLTPQMVKRVTSRFKNRVAIYHSGLNNQEKYEEYMKVKNKEASIVVGTRSAIFMPFYDLGLIVIDEEHDLSYKQDSSPKYHCRDVAIYRAEKFKAKVVLGSATPSLDSYARALRGVYELVTLEEKVNKSSLNIKLIDSKEEIKNKKSYIISKPLEKAILERLENKEQVILLLNRRGFTTSLKCSECNHIIMCPHCDIAMSYHADIRMMKCHICDTRLPVLKKCPTCSSLNSFSGFGYGIQRVESELKGLFKDARIIRMDSDTVSKKNSYQKLLEKFENYEADILLGTQMISKGLDYPRVSLVGILNGDAGLSRLDYRSQEITFDLLVQASGRSGRSAIKGEVIIQVFDSKNPVIKNALNQDYKRFFYEEMKFRKLGSYPPYTYLVAILISGFDEERCERDANDFYYLLKGDFKVLKPLKLLKIKDRVRMRILIKGKNLDEIRRAVYRGLEESKAKSSILVDVNPLILD